MIKGGIFIKRIAAVLSLATTFTLAFAGSIYAKEDTAKQKVIVTFKEKTDANKKLILKNNGSIEYEFKNIPAFSAELDDESIGNLKKNPAVLSVEIDKKIKLIVNSNSTLSKQNEDKGQVEDWGIKSVNAKKSWTIGATGKNVKIAIVDSGIDYNHKDLKVAGGVSFVREVMSDGTVDKSYYDYAGHGTHVAGIIAAKNNNFGTVGVAPDSSLYAVKVINSIGEATLENILAGVDWSITSKMNIINLSLGSPQNSETLKKLMEKAKKNGIFVIAAAGNSGSVNQKVKTSVSFPARYPEVVAVAAIDENHKHAFFSSYGPEVDISAPGVKVLSTFPNNKYMYLDGTSMATPYVSGVVALYKSAYPNTKYDDLIKTLYSNAIDVEDKGIDDKTGVGLIQAPTSVGTPPVALNTKITTFTTNFLYNAPNEKQRLSSQIKPQVLYAIKKEGDFILVKTWKGNKYIKTKMYLEGEKKTIKKKITLKEKVTLYKYPLENHKTTASVGYQQLESIEEINGWYLVKTWLGYRYIHPKAPIVENDVEDKN